jgi:glycosyltransferase 2 family protein
VFPKQQPRAVLAGFAGAILVLAALFQLVGVGELVGVLAGADATALVLVALAAAGWLLAWSLALRTVLASLGVEIGVAESVLVFTGTVFANNVTPFGQAGGEPVGALLISEVADTRYETGLAAIVSVDAIRLFPPVGFALLGLGYYAVTTTLSDRTEAIAVALLAIAICLPCCGIVLWRFRHRVRGRVARGLDGVLGPIGRAVPRWNPPDLAAIEARIDGFVLALERIADDPRRVTRAFAFSTLGWFSLIGCLWLSLVALGFRDPQLLAAAFVAIPLGSLGAATPLPGGLGGIEAAIVAVLAPITGLPAAAAAGAVVIYRAATYWMPTVVGGAAVAAYGFANR